MCMCIDLGPGLVGHLKGTLQVLKAIGEPFDPGVPSSIFVSMFQPRKYQARQILPSLAWCLSGFVDTRLCGRNSEAAYRPLGHTGPSMG